jgi:uncharacterized protein
LKHISYKIRDTKSKLDKMDEFRIRDPIHNFISFSEKEINIINTEIFQRLRRIRQLALADLVYPGCTHTRFEHSLGVSYIADKIARQLISAAVINDRDILPIRIAALLHDLGHGPFSHISEYILTKNYRPKKGSRAEIEEIHEDITIRLIKTSKIFKNILGPKLLHETISILENRDVRKDIVSGSLDADKLDYLLRDAYYAGVKYGSFDLAKILESLIPIETGRSAHLGINFEGIHAVEQLILAKHHMTVQVYRHRVRAITDAMIIRGIELAIKHDDKVIKELYEYKISNMYLENYIKWCDIKVIDHMLNCKYANAREIFQRLYQRRLFKLIHRKAINDKEMKDVGLRSKFLSLEDGKQHAYEKRISNVKELNCNSDHVILNIITIKNPTYRAPLGKISEDEIQVKLEDGVTIYLKEIYGSVMNLANIEDKQQYIEVYAPGEKWQYFKKSQKEKYLKKLDNEIATILYS